jgi:cellobiose phosphorylase
MPIEGLLYQFMADRLSFQSKSATSLRQIYLPLSGGTYAGVKSAITPFLSGDIKVDRDAYVTKPVSREDLRNSLRNAFFYIENKGVVSLSEETTSESAQVEIGPLWQKLLRRHPSYGLELEAWNFVPINNDSVELMQIVVRNVSRKTLKVTVTTAIPLFGRALANKHDHEHVTSLLNRARQLPEGVLVVPTMIFNEEGHQQANRVYFVLGRSAKGENPIGTFPTFDSFYGDSGSFERPQAVYANRNPGKLAAHDLNGKEVVGALRFKTEALRPGMQRAYYVVIGTANNEKEARKIMRTVSTPEGFIQALKSTQKYWYDIATSIRFSSANPDFDNWMKWVNIQPTLRRLWGCSFLPDHDYGKGGKGWRDLWQDLLALILTEPEKIRGDLSNNFMGVRIDGTNATIVGSNPGEFRADRNAITRVWMDHGIWPLLTTMHYVHQTGDTGVLFEEVCYFRDTQLSRTFEKDLDWRPEDGTQLKTISGAIYQGTILEHLLLQNLVQFFNVGEHNLIRLENADWNDGLDMAFSRGESVTFSAMYAGNLMALAQLLEDLDQAGQRGESFLMAKEMQVLLDSTTHLPCDYNSAEDKRRVLFESYFKSVQPKISGERLQMKFKDAASDLRKKAQWLFEKIRHDEFLQIQDGQKSYRWFNGYYDNMGQKVEGKKDGQIRMTLTGQVFPLMSGLANSQEIKDVVTSVGRFLEDPAFGGIHLNTDFGVRNYPDLGRAFSFAYGTKENGAFFSHMIVMFAYALYKNSFVREGHKVLQSLYQMCQDGSQAKIYPGIPEYFDLTGRGMYPYLTGSASWMVLTMLTQVFGVRGQCGHLVLNPKLVKEQFSSQGLAGAECYFAGKRVVIIYQNRHRQDYGRYRIKEIALNDKSMAFEYLSPGTALIPREQIVKVKSPVTIKVRLEA